jgi:hypothetical protein
MAVTIRQRESIPATYPDAPAGLSAAATALSRDVIWRRIESYIAWRWTARDVTWLVQGPGEWVAPLTPATISTVEVWGRANVWEVTTLDASPPGGYFLRATGPYRFTASVGGGVVPASVNQAFAGSITLSHSRDESWMANALVDSGAADLLRPFRKA